MKPTWILDPATNTWVVQTASANPAPASIAGSMEEMFDEEGTSRGFVGGTVNYGGQAIRALPKVPIEATTTKPDNGKFMNLEVDGDAIFHGKVAMAAGVHTQWYDASQPAGTDIVIDLANGPQQFVVLGENKTIWIPSKPDEELMFSILILQDSTGAWTVDWQINGGDQETDGLPIVYWPDGTEPVMTATADTCDMYSFTWIALLNSGKGAYVGMATQNMKVPVAP